MKFIDNLHPVLKAYLFGFAPSLLAFILIVWVGKSDWNPEFNEGTLTISAPYSLIFQQNFSWLSAIIGLLLSGAVPAWYAAKYKGLSAGTGEYSGGHVYAFGWIVFLLFTLVPYIWGNGSAEYTYICQSLQEFQHYKANPAEVLSLFK